MVKKNNGLLGGVDDPLLSPQDDSLNRASFAKRVFTILENTPLEANLRVGILGDWGSGKTTVLNFIRHYCHEQGHPTAMFHPWQYHSREDAWKGLVTSIDKGISTVEGSKANFRRKRFIKDISGKAKKLAEIAGSGIGKAIGELLLSPLESKLEETKENVAKDLNKILDGKRFYVFIDDLDRAEPDVVYDMLMLFHEIFNINQCVFIFGLDVKTVSKVLQKKLGYINPKDFLDKIINWPFELPLPTSYDWKDLLEEELKKSTGGIKKDVMENILFLLPESPRKFKHYVRYLDSLHKGFLDRFDHDELDWKMLYIAQLMALEFPEVFKFMKEDGETIKDIAVGKTSAFIKGWNAAGLGAEKEEQAKFPDKLLKKIESNNLDKERFLNIYIELRECGGTVAERTVKNVLQVIETPELMTWKEYRLLKGGLLKAEGSALVKKLRKFVVEGEVELVREFIKKLLREYGIFWEHIISLSTESEQGTYVEDAGKVLVLCDSVLEVDKLFTGDNSVFDRDTFDEWIEPLTKYVHFQEPKKLHGDMREREKSLIVKIANKNVHRPAILAEWFEGKFKSNPFPEKTATLAPVKQVVDDIIKQGLPRHILNLFEKPGTGKLWMNGSSRIESKILFKNDSFFHTEDNYSLLAQISKKAYENIEIQKNFLETLGIMLEGAASNEFTQNKDTFQDLINNKRFFQIIWDGATCKSLNRRWVGSLETQIKQLETNKLIDEAHFKRPEWWKALIPDRINELYKNNLEGKE